MGQELLEKITCSEEGYHPLVYFEGWRVAFLNDTAKFHAENIREMQRHNTSDEVFILLEGTCTLYVSDGTGSELGRLEGTVMEKGGYVQCPKRSLAYPCDWSGGRKSQL